MGGIKEIWPFLSLIRLKLCVIWIWPYDTKLVGNREANV